MEALFVKNEGLIRGICAKQSLSYDDTNDVVQDLYIKFARKFGQFDPGKGSLQGWLYRMTERHIIDFYRKKNRELNRTLCIEDGEDEDYFVQLIKEGYQVEEVNDEAIDILYLYIAKLEQPYRDVLKMHLQEYKHREIAEQELVRSTNAVGTYIGRAKERLEKLLKADGYTWDDFF